MKKESFDKSFDSLDEDLVNELYSAPAATERKRGGYSRTLKIAASVAVVAAFVAVGAVLLRSPKTTDHVSGTEISDDQQTEISKDQNEVPADEVPAVESGSERSEDAAVTPIGGEERAPYCAVDNVFQQELSSPDRRTNNVYGMNHEKYELWNGIYVTEYLRTVVENYSDYEHEYSVAVNIVPRLGAEELDPQNDERLPIDQFVWNGQTYCELMEKQNECELEVMVLNHLLKLANDECSPQEYYQMIAHNDEAFAAGSEFLESMIEVTEDGYLLDHSKIEAEYKRYLNIRDELVDEADKARNAYYEQYPVTTAPVIPDEWIEYWINVLDENGVEYSISEMGFFLVVPCEEFERIASIASVKSNMEGFTFDALFGLTLLHSEGSEHNNID